MANTLLVRRTLVGAVIAIGALLIVAYKVNPYFFAPKNTGSFEYVRRGEELLNKGDYKRALAYFEQASGASPDNKAIGEYLAWAYSKYGMALAESDPESALVYLTKAYEASPTRTTIQNLARMQSKEALRCARGGEWREAVMHFDKARSVARESVSAGKGLAISLFNDAVDEYKSDRKETAILCLKESALVDEEPRALEFLGEIYYMRRDLEKALFYWGKVRDLDPGYEGIAEKIERLFKEIALAKGEEKKDLPHFELRYERPLSSDLAAVNEVLEMAYFDVGKELGYYPASKTTVVLYSEEDFRDIFKLPRIVRAFYDGSIRMPIPKGALTREELGHYLYHEYAHAAVSAMTNNNCPIWLSEGISMWIEYKGRDTLIRGLVAGSGKDAAVSLKDLDAAFRSVRGDGEMGRWYATAYTVVKFIVDTWGRDSLIDILKKVSDGQHVVNAIDDVVLLSEKEFEERWHKHVRATFPS